MAADSQNNNGRPKRSYSDTEIGHALAVLKSNGGNILRTSRELDIPRQTLTEWSAHKRRDSPEVREIQRQKEATILDAYAFIERACLKHAGKAEVIAEMSGLEAIKGAAIARDKQQIISGQPTSIHEERTIDSRQVLVLLQQSIGEPGSTPPPTLNPADTES